MLFRSVGKKKMKQPMRKLDTNGQVKNHCGLVNDEQALKKMKNKQMVNDSMAQIEELQRKLAQEKKRKAAEDQEELAPKAKAKLAQKQVVAQLTKPEIASLLTVYFKTKTDTKQLKEPLVLALEDAMAAKPDVLGVQLKEKAGPTASVAAAEAPAVAPGGSVAN